MDDSRPADSWTNNPIWQLYVTYGQAHLSYAGLGVVSTVLGRLFGLVPALVIGLAVDAIFLRERAPSPSRSSPTRGSRPRRQRNCTSRSAS